MAALDLHAALRAAKVAPGRAPPWRAWSTGPAGDRQRPAASSQRGCGCHRPHGKPCWPMRSIPRESTPRTYPHPRTTRITSNACRGHSRRRGEKEGACGTSPQAKHHADTPPRHPTSANVQTPAAPAAPQGPRAPHNMTRRTPRPAAPPPNPRGYTPGAAPRPHASDAPCRPNNRRTRPSRADDTESARRPSLLGADPARRPTKRQPLQWSMATRYPASHRR